ncbi:ABC transporter permease [Allokutzneria albata]|uniref:ABC-2 type transport system permease protein n=1 Tax=Allokutzneria albata TaxID=211114 RepID=A0A1H0AZV3_ALLAB|nr:ABC transporter permease [Allokutzneria albata]SDN38944.1 ABC-2 type transport system permease protein [Allokutzneria albata]
MSKGSVSVSRGVWLVAKRELNTRVRSKAFVIGTAAIIVVIAAYVGVMFFVGQSMSQTTVGMTGQASVLAEPLKASAKALGEDVTTTTVPDVATGERQVTEGEIDVLVSGATDKLQVLVKKDLGNQVRAALDGLVRQQALDAELAEAGLDPNAVRTAVAEARFEVRTIEPEDPERGERLGVAMGVTFLLYGSLLMFGMAVAQGVVEEKSSRVIELLLSSVRPWQLLAGKVLGIGLVGLLQMGIVAGVGLTAAIQLGVLTLPQGAVLVTVLSAVVWYFLGFFLYAVMFAMAGSLVSRQEDINSVVQPLMFSAIIPFVLTFITIPRDPESKLLEVLSFIPPFSPIVMPARAALGVAPAWQVIVSVVLAVAALAGLIWLAGRVFGNAVLRTGSRVKLRDALRST